MIGIDMPMPAQCIDCPLANYNMGTMYCKAFPRSLKEGFRTISFTGKRNDCPLIDLSRMEDDRK